MTVTLMRCLASSHLVLCKFAKQGYQVTEFPIEYYPRSFEEGKKLRAFKDGSQILKTILKSYFI